MARLAPYGTWRSPIGADDVVAGLVGFAELGFADGSLYWVERRPDEDGRQVLVTRRPTGEIEDLTPPPISVRTRVHEYGGGSLVVGGGEVLYSDFATQRLHRIEAGGPAPLTPEPPRPGSLRYADGRILADGRLVCVRESHPPEGEAVNELVVVDLDTGETTVLAGGRDFYAAPRPRGDGRLLAWVEWNHPNMPWDGTELKVGEIAGDRLVDVARVAGGPEESIVEPQWAPDDALIFHSDRGGWWNLHRWDGRQVSPLLLREADFAEPAWVFGRSTFAFLSGGRILGGFWEEGSHHLAVLHPDGGLQTLDDDLTEHGRITTDGSSMAWFVGEGPGTPATLFELDVDQGTVEAVRANPVPVSPSYFYRPRPISFPTGGGETAHAIYYPPHNPDYEAPPGDLPPLIVRIHGGPTSHVSPILDTGFLYWTTRGFGVVDVNHRGSSGYGRRYRNRLRGNWGIVDVEDARAAARYLADQGEAHPDRLVIRGGSAGGYTTLAALAFGEEFGAGASYYGVADLELLAKHTHKFESRYVDGLVGTDPEEMRRRSPLYSADRITAPVILFQGLEDRVVPPEQAEMIASALEANGIPHAHITLPDEDHGFRRAENITYCLESELAFYGLVLGFAPQGDLPQVTLVEPATADEVG